MRQSEFLSRLSVIKMVILDVDGVMTDGSIWLDGTGEETKRFNIYDGQGIYLLHRAGVNVAIISGRKSRVVEMRAKELGIKNVYQGVLDKLSTHQIILKEHHLQQEEVLYIGDDLIDIPAMKNSGVAVAVKNAIPEVKKVADYITEKEGGDGAIREVINFLLAARNFDPSY